MEWRLSKLRHLVFHDFGLGGKVVYLLRQPLEMIFEVFVELVLFLNILVEDLLQLREGLRLFLVVVAALVLRCSTGVVVAVREVGVITPSGVIGVGVGVIAPIVVVVPLV